MPPSSLRVLLYGDPHIGHFEPIVDLIRRTIGDSHLRSAQDAERLRNLTAGGASSPELIVVFQAWPDQFSVTEVNAILAQFPHAHLICCYGPWCDSDGRNRSLWPLAVRVPAASFAMRFQREMALLGGAVETASQYSPAAEAPAPGRNSTGLPLTASRTEIFEFDLGREGRMPPSDIPAAVLSPDRRWREMLVAALQKRGLPIVDEASIARSSAIYVDIDPWDARQASQVASIRQTHPRARVIACGGFPRADLETAAREAGADEFGYKLDSLDRLAGLAAAGTRAGI